MNQFCQESIDKQKVNEYLRLKKTLERQATSGFNTLSGKEIKKLQEYEEMA